MLRLLQKLHVRCLRNEWGEAGKFFLSWNLSGDRDFTIWPPGNACALYRKAGGVRSLVTNRPPGKPERCSESLRVLRVGYSWVWRLPLPLSSRSPGLVRTSFSLSLLIVFPFHVNVSIYLVFQLPKKGPHWESLPSVPLSCWVECLCWAMC